jgi:hypothetical protein
MSTGNTKSGQGPPIAPTGRSEHELNEWTASAAETAPIVDMAEPPKTRSKLRLIAVLVGLNVSTTPSYSAALMRRR